MKLEPQEKAFFRELVFVLKTFFFVYIGLSIPFDNMSALLYGGLITLVLFVMRLLLIKFIIGKKTPSYDKSVMSLMIPKGLAAAVLATMPEQVNLQRGVEVIPGAETIKYVTYSVVFISILFTSILILLMDRVPLLRRFYSFFFGKISTSQDTLDEQQQQPENEVEKQSDIFQVFTKDDSDDDGQTPSAESETATENGDESIQTNTESDED